MAWVIAKTRIIARIQLQIWRRIDRRGVPTPRQFFKQDHEFSANFRRAYDTPVIEDCERDAMRKICRAQIIKIIAETAAKN